MVGSLSTMKHFLVLDQSPSMSEKNFVSSVPPIDLQHGHHMPGIAVRNSFSPKVGEIQPAKVGNFTPALTLMGHATGLPG